MKFCTSANVKVLSFELKLLISGKLSLIRAVGFVFLVFLAFRKSAALWFSFCFLKCLKIADAVYINIVIFT